MEKKVIKFNRVCYVGTIYSLLIYLLYSSLEDIHSTFFIFANGIPTEISNRIPNSLVLNETELKKRFWYKIFLRSIYFRWIADILVKNKIRRILGSNYELFAQDHLFFATAVIGSRNYTLIEDSKSIFSLVNNNPYYQGMWRKRERRNYCILKRLYGSVLYNSFGRGQSCKAILLTKDDKEPSIQNKVKIFCDLHDLWKKSSIEKKSYINAIYNLTSTDIEMFEKVNYVLFTQCLFPDFISLKEHIQLYKQIISSFVSDGLVIKTHPRDTVRYEQYIDNIKVFRKNIPTQLLTLNGVKFINCITIYSSAVFDLEISGKIFWYGSKISDKLYRAVGDIPMPLNAIFKSV